MNSELRFVAEEEDTADIPLTSLLTILDMQISVRWHPCRCSDAMLQNKQAAVLFVEFLLIFRQRGQTRSGSAPTTRPAGPWAFSPLVLNSDSCCKIAISPVIQW